MAVDERISQLAVGVPAAGDYVPFVDDPGGTPVTKKFLWDQGIVDLAALDVTNGNFIVGDGSNWVEESGATARTSLGLGTGDSPTFAGITANGAGLINVNSATAFVVEDTSTSDNVFVVRTDNGRIGIGTDTPGGGIHTKHSTASILERTRTTPFSTPISVIQIGLDGGTPAAGGGPSFLMFSDNDAASKSFMGRMTAVWENPAAGSEAAGIEFNIRPNNADTNATTRAFGCAANGDVIFAASGTPLGQIHVDTEDATAGQPVAYWNQADIDQPFFQFATTIGVGNAIEAVGAKTLTTTHFIMIEIPGSLTRYVPCGTIA